MLQIGADMRKFCKDIFDAFDDDGSGEIDNEELGAPHTAHAPVILLGTDTHAVALCDHWCVRCPTTVHPAVPLMMRLMRFMGISVDDSMEERLVNEVLCAPACSTCAVLA